MDIGHIHIPKPKLEKVAVVHDIETHLYFYYLRFIEKGGVYENVLTRLEQDPRVQALNGRLISKGCSAAIFQTQTLAIWFLWAINEYGQESTEINLNRFLDSETAPVINALWVLGINVEKPIELENGIRILPIEEMPFSREKEQYSKHDFPLFGHPTPKPKAAITCTFEINKISADEDFLADNKQFFESSALLHEVALLLNALDGISCIPYFSTSYTLPEMPFGIFGGSGGGAPLYDIFGYGFSTLPATCANEVNDLIHAYDKLTTNRQSRMVRVLSRLSQGKRREQIEDKILDLGIALEMALLADNKKNDQLSLTFRLRGSWLIGTTPEERQVIYGQLRDLYDYRSQVAHSGELCGNKAIEIEAVRKKFPEYECLASRIIRHLICADNLDWTKLVLGVG
ncbi:MAG TPA: hypothetical protein VIN36_00105 [Thiobacillus sp.]